MAVDYVDAAHNDVVVEFEFTVTQMNRNHTKISDEHENADDVDVSASNHCGAS